MAYSVNTPIGDGTTKQFAVSFTNGLFSRDSVHVFVEGEEDGTGTPIERTFTWINDGLIELDGDAPASGLKIEIRRIMDKDAPAVDYEDGEILTEATMDKSLDHLLNSIHELLDGYGLANIQTDVSLNGNLIIDVAAAIESNHAVNLGQVNNIITASSSDLVSTFDIETFTAGAGDTTFTLQFFEFVPDTKALSVYVNGLYQIHGTDYTEVGTDTIEFTSALQLGDEVVISGARYDATHAANVAEASATAAQLAAANADASEVAAAASAASASASADTATTKANEAANSAAEAAATLTEFTNIYYGPLANDPATRPDTSPSTAGDLYYNTTSLTMKEYNGTVWEVVAATEAADVAYNNTVSGLTADTVQEALDETATNVTQRVIYANSTAALPSAVASFVGQTALVTGAESGTFRFDGASWVRQPDFYNNTTSGLSAVTIQNAIDEVVANASEKYASTLSGISSLVGMVEGDTVHLGLKNRAGQFVFRAGDQSANVTNDPQQGVWIAPASSPTGTNGAWERANTGILSVLWFGATGDGTTDDNTTINACLSFAPEGSTVFFPAPLVEYRVSGPLRVDRRMKVVGSMSKIRCISGNCFEIDPAASNTLLQGFVLQGTHTNSNHIALKIAGDYTTVRDIEAYEFEKGFEVWAGVWHRLEKIRLRNMRIHVGSISNVVGTVVEDLRYDTDTASFAQPVNGGIILSGEGCNFSDMDLIRAGSTGLYITTNTGRNSTWNFFNSCSFDTSTRGVWISSLDPAYSIRGMMFDHCWFASHSDKGVFLEGNYNLTGVTFDGCTFVSNGIGALDVAEASTEVLVQGCTFAENSRALSGTYPHILHRSQGTLQVRNSTFSAWSGSTTNVASAAIERTLPHGYLLLDGNYAMPLVNNAGLIRSSSSSLAVGTNYGSFVDRHTNIQQNVWWDRAASGITDANGKVTIPHDIGPDAWGAMSQMSPESGKWCAVTAVDATNVTVQVRDIGTGAIAASQGPWIIEIQVYTRVWG